MRLSRSFFEQKTLKVAKELLGCFLIRQIGEKQIVGRIIETEAYCGPKDLANHASRGRTKRTELMFGPAGHAYVYLIYGMYYCFNIVTEGEGYPGAVLVRGVDIVDNRRSRTEDLRSKIKDLRSKKIIGPGKVCREMKIDKELNGIDVVVNKRLWVDGQGSKIAVPAHSSLSLRAHPSESKTGRQEDLRSKINNKKFNIIRLPRIGVDYAGEYKDKLWRFKLTN